MVGRIGFALERWDLPRRSSHVAQLFSLGSVRASIMKTTILIVAVIALAIICVACKRKSADTLPQEAGVVVFPDAGVSLVVGDGWKRIDISAGLPVCPPTLVGSAGLIRATLCAPAISDLQAASNRLRSIFDDNPDAVKDSFQEEGFTTDSGLQGQHISFSAQTTIHGSVTEMRSHNFIVQRQDGRFVAISFITTVRTDSDAVRQMIQKSLKLQ